MNYAAYLSSTLNDLKDERDAVRDALSDECVLRHSYLASEGELIESCLQDVACCDVYILILGLRYGYVPKRPDNPGNLSITELEYQQAKNKPRLVFIKDEQGIPFPLTDAKTKEHPLERIESFRNRAADDQRPAFFRTAADLKLAVVKAFTAFKDDRDHRINQEEISADDLHARALRVEVKRHGTALHISALNQGTHVIRDIEINAIPDDEDWFEQSHGPLPKLIEGGGRGVEVVYPIAGGWFYATVAQLSPSRGCGVASFETTSADYTQIDFDVFWNDHTGKQRKAHKVADVNTLEGDLWLEPRK
jgi:hypothetical protein